MIDTILETNPDYKAAYYAHIEARADMLALAEKTLARLRMNDVEGFLGSLREQEELLKQGYETDEAVRVAAIVAIERWLKQGQEKLDSDREIDALVEHANRRDKRSTRMAGK